MGLRSLATLFHQMCSSSITSGRLLLEIGAGADWLGRCLCPAIGSLNSGIPMLWDVILGAGATSDHHAFPQLA